MSTAFEQREKYLEIRSDKHEITSVMAYMLGIPSMFFGTIPVKCFDSKVYNALGNDKNARTIRNLCSIRMAIVKNFGQMTKAFDYEMKNIDSYSMTKDAAKQLRDDKIELFKANCKPAEYLVRVNGLITGCIDQCKKLFPEWANWIYIRRLFITRECASAQDSRECYKKYLKNLEVYPYQTYINMSITNKDGNVLYNDEKFLSILYCQNGDEFKAYANVKGEGRLDRRNIYDFVNASKNTVAVVDCENCDPIKFCAVMQSMAPETLSKITKIILYNDVNSSTAWKLLPKYTSAAIEHNMTERVKQGKSLVDIVLVAGCCKEHYKNGVDSFLLFSSDSDYWGLISSVESANFLVMLESNKTSDEVISKMQDADIHFCFIDKFCRDKYSYQLRHDALLEECQSFVDKHVTPFNISEMMRVALAQTRIEMSEREKSKFISEKSKSLHLNVNVNGDVTVGFNL